MLKFWPRKQAKLSKGSFWELLLKEGTLQIKTTMRYHLTLVRMANLNNSGSNLAMMWRKRISLHYWWECKLVQRLWKTVWRFLKKLKRELPYDPAIALLGIYPRDTGVLIQGAHVPQCL